MSQFYRYQHSRQLVKALNGFVDTTQDMPDGWEKKLNQQGRVSHMTYSHMTGGNEYHCAHVGVFHRSRKSHNDIH